MDIQIQKIMIEDVILSKCHIWLWNEYPDLRFCCWHIANERKTNKIQGAQLKAKGVVAGVPDYVVNYKGKTYYFEFKTDIGYLTKQQKILHESLNKQGFEVYVIRSEEEFKSKIKEILNIQTYML